MPAVSFASLLPLGDTTIRHELLGFFWIVWALKGSGSKPNGSTPQIAISDNWCVFDYDHDAHDDPDAHGGRAAADEKDEDEDEDADVSHYYYYHHYL